MHWALNCILTKGVNLNSKLTEFVIQWFSIRFKTNLNSFERTPERIKEQCYEYLQICYTDQNVFICNSYYSATFSLRQLQIQYCSFLLQRVLSKRLQQCTINSFLQKISDLLFEKPGIIIGHCAIVNIPGLFSSRTM